MTDHHQQPSLLWSDLRIHHPVDPGKAADALWRSGWRDGFKIGLILGVPIGAAALIVVTMIALLIGGVRP